MRDPVKRQAARTRYNHTARGKAARRRYLKTAKGKARLQRSEQRNRWPRWILQAYGLTVEEYAWLLYRQEFRCPICEKSFSFQIISAKTQTRTTRPCVDHDHTTGCVRGLVCGWCNYNILGPMEKVGMDGVHRAISYLDAAANNADAIRTAILMCDDV